VERGSFPSNLTTPAATGHSLFADIRDRTGPRTTLWHLDGPDGTVALHRVPSPLLEQVQVQYRARVVVASSSSAVSRAEQRRDGLWSVSSTRRLASSALSRRLLLQYPSLSAFDDVVHGCHHGWFQPHPEFGQDRHKHRSKRIEVGL
jgi:hypothetical protein